MSELLFVDACIRGAQSRTRRLAEHFLSAYAQHHPEVTVTRRDLVAERLEPFYPETLAEEETLAAAGALSHPLFAPARQFAAAGRIVLAAPFWELSFPAILKIYLERISRVGVTFAYGPHGPVGLCKAEKLLLVTTRGGDYSAPETAWMEMGARQIEALCAMYGIPEFQLLCAEGLDDQRNDPEVLLAAAMQRGETLAASF